MIEGIENRAFEPESSSFESFYQGSRDLLYRALALALADADLAADAIDEAMTRTLERWDEVARYDNPAGWVYRVGLNWGRSMQRRNSRIPKRFSGGESYEMSVPEPGLAEAVAALPHRYRTVIVARYYLQWTPAEIAEAIRVPGATVRSRLRRALERLRCQIGESA
ncbi:MAG: sigma-70 family RNA polymerase sigma factor [Acidimicrobiia bacterium]